MLFHLITRVSSLKKAHLLVIGVTEFHKLRNFKIYILGMEKKNKSWLINDFAKSFSTSNENSFSLMVYIIQQRLNWEIYKTFIFPGRKLLGLLAKKAKIRIECENKIHMIKETKDCH